MAIRSTFSGLYTMYRGVSTNRLALDTTGHNMTNSSAEGYSRQLVTQAAVRPESVYTNSGGQFVGLGVDAISIARARDVYSDKEYWKENPIKEYYTTRQKNYQKLESVFNDATDSGPADGILKFYQSWVDLSTTASSTSYRTAVLEEGRIIADRIKSCTKQLQDQINSQYGDIRTNVDKVNDITDQIVNINKTIMANESTGAMANDLRDARDNLVDELSGFIGLSVSEDENGMYTVVSNGVTLVNGITKLQLKMSNRIDNEKYGVTDYNIELANTGLYFSPFGGTLEAELDSIAEDKAYIDTLSHMAAFLLTDFNAQHKAGAGMDLYVPNTSTNAFPTTGINFFGEDGKGYFWDETDQCIRIYNQTSATNWNGTAWTTTVTTSATSSAAGYDQIDGVKIINALEINSVLSAPDGERKIATRAIEYSTTPNYSPYTPSPTANPNTGAATLGAVSYTVTDVNGTADGSNAVLLSTFLNQEFENRTNCAIGVSSFQGYYGTAMTALGVESDSCNTKLEAQQDLVEQVTQWRTSVAGVNWDEELTNMIMFQQGYTACSRCLTTMDEMLDRLINSTGTVGR